MNKIDGYIMNERKFTFWNRLTAAFVFVISAAVYLLTIEPTASFWDCGEFIASSYKLEVGHPPGNPIFMLMGRVFCNFASDASQMALMVNAMSGLLSALTILLLFSRWLPKLKRTTKKDTRSYLLILRVVSYFHVKVI